MTAVLVIALGLLLIIGPVLELRRQRRKRYEANMAEVRLAVARMQATIGEQLLPALVAIIEPTRRAAEAFRHFGEILNRSGESAE